MTAKIERRRAFWKLVRWILDQMSICELQDGGWNWVIIRYKGREYTFDLVYSHVTRVGSEPMRVSRVEAALLYAIAKKIIKYNQKVIRNAQMRKAAKKAVAHNGESDSKNTQPELPLPGGR